jgi:molecular chaperone GrpE
MNERAQGVYSEDAAASEATTQVASDADAASAAEDEPTAADAAGAAGEVPPTQEEGEDHEGKVASDLEELTAQAAKAQEYLALAQRTKADFENYRRRAARDAAAAQERGVLKLARELLPAVDNLDRTLEAAAAAGDGKPDDALVSGVRLVHSELLATLARAGIERFSPEGEQFDPQCHEAVAQYPVEGAEAGKVVEVYQRGYRLGDAVIRPARVVVAG